MVSGAGRALGSGVAGQEQRLALVLQNKIGRTNGADEMALSKHVNLEKHVQPRRASRVRSGKAEQRLRLRLERPESGETRMVILSPD